MSAVEAEGLVKHYPNKAGAVEAVRGVDLHVDAGEVFGFLGPNGAGKSTTVKMLTTRLSITSGSAQADRTEAAQRRDDQPGHLRDGGAALDRAPSTSTGPTSSRASAS
jgi:ABC-2 type transport system ATP-binding protein